MSARRLYQWLSPTGRRIGALTAALTLSLTGVAAAATTQAGSQDFSFGAGGAVSFPVGSWGGAAAVAVQPNGAIVTAGQALLNGVNVIVATRMTVGGQFDQTFGNHGIVTVDINGGAGVDSGAAMALQSDGKIVIVGGGVSGLYGPTMFAAVRLNTNGSLDQTFGHGGIASVPVGTYSIANAVVVQPDGKIDLAGTAVNGHIEFAAARLNANGSIDTSFGNNGAVTLSPTGGAWGMILQKNGKLVLAGQADYNNPQVAGAQQFMAARLNANGTLDTTFAQGGIAMIPVGATALGFGIAQQADSKLLVAGIAFTNANVNAIVRLNTDGTLDPSYGNGGIGTIQSYYGTNGITLDSSGRPILPLIGPGAERFNTNGTPDTTFGNNGTALVSGITGAANGAAIQPDGKIVLAGATTISGQIEFNVSRLNVPATGWRTPRVATTATPLGTTTPVATSTTPATATRALARAASACSAVARPGSTPRRSSQTHRRHRHSHSHAARMSLMKPALACFVGKG